MRVEINKYIVADSEIYRKSSIFGRSRNASHFGICHGKPTFKGTRVMVWQVLELLEAGTPVEEIMNYFITPLTKEQIKAALHYASVMAKGGDNIVIGIER